jgi:hypothetical protein
MRAVIAIIFAAAVIAAGCGDTATVGKPTSDESAPSAKWVEVISMSGGGGLVTKKSQPFKLEGGEQKLVGKLTGDEEYGSGNWTLQGLGEYADVDWVDVGKPGRVNSRTYVEGGRYYLDCNTCNSKWHVTLYELR